MLARLPLRPAGTNGIPRSRREQCPSEAATIQIMQSVTIDGTSRNSAVRKAVADWQLPQISSSPLEGARACINHKSSPNSTHPRGYS
jgi:hypothetical protein